VTDKPEELSSIIDRLTNAPTVRDAPLARGELGAVVGVLNDMGDGDAMRKLFLHRVYGKTSIKEVDEDNRIRLFEWIGFYKEEDCWRTSPEFRRQFYVVLTDAVRQLAHMERSAYLKLKSEIGNVPASMLQYIGKDDGVIKKTIKEI
jgi:hypothetical protein